MKPTIELLRDVLDHDIVDVDGVRCGMVDDIELEEGSAATPVVAALIVGPGAWQARLPALVAVAAAWLFGRAKTRVPWSEVAELSQSVKLKRRASELGLGRIERKAATWLKRIPGS
jgi:sporulation protein YlmC with PRC-barrel domain